MKFNLTFGKMFATLAVVMTGYSTLMAGYDAGKHHYDAMTTNIILGVFWGAVLAAMAYQAIREAHLQSDDEFTKQMDDLLAKIKELAPKQQDHEHEMVELLAAICRDIVGETPRKPTSEEVARIEQAFHDSTDHFVKLTVHEEGMECEISKQPFDRGDEIDRAFGEEDLETPAYLRKGHGLTKEAEKRSEPAARKIAVKDGDAEEELRAKRREAGLKSAITRKKNQAKAARLAKKNAKK